MHFDWSHLLYDLLEDRHIDYVIIKNFYFFFIM